MHPLVIGPPRSGFTLLCSVVSELLPIDPPRLDLFLAKAYDLLDTTVTGIRNNKSPALVDMMSSTEEIGGKEGAGRGWPSRS